MKKIVVEFVKVFAVSLTATIIVTVLWNLISHGSITIDWETSFRFAIVFGILFTWMEVRRGNGK